MNWGKGIVLGLVVFVTFISVLSIKMFSQNNDEYDRDYYEKGLNYDADFNKQKQVVTDGAAPQIGIAGKMITLQFKKAAKGSLRFVRPSDHDMDRYLSFNTDATGKWITQAPFKGQWQLVLNWKSDDKTYQYKQELFIP